MISPHVLKFCKDNISLIENYDKAINSEEMYVCHHRLETDLELSRETLINIGRYYNVPASELIFLTRAEHNIIHKTGSNHSEITKNKISEAHKDKHHTEETRKQMSEAQKERFKKYEHPMKGKTAWNKGLHTASGENNPCYGRTKEKHPLYGKHWKLENGKRIYYTI